MRKFNFNAGPSTLPLEVLERAQEEFVEFRGAGMSIIEMSHRTKEYDAIHNQAVALTRELLNIPETHHVIFLQGGATLQFAMIPLNLLTKEESCDFTMTGAWAKKAYEDAARIGKVKVVFDGKENNFMTLPDPASLKLDPAAKYVHVTSNETIGGVQWQDWPETGDVPLVADMSSDIMSRPLPMERFGLIYAGAQKNLGPAGMALVIIRNDVLEACNKGLPAYLSYGIHVAKNSLYNTPSVFAIYMFQLTMEWLKKQGGMNEAVRLADERSQAIYDVIDEQSQFYRCPVQREVRSKMNVVFRLPSEELEKKFVAEASELGLHGLKGHRSVGGCRASIYNAMPAEGAHKLAQFMLGFMKAHS